MRIHSSDKELCLNNILNPCRCPLRTKKKQFHCMWWHFATFQVPRFFLPFRPKNIDFFWCFGILKKRGWRPQKLGNVFGWVALHSQKKLILNRNLAWHLMVEYFRSYSILPDWLWKEWLRKVPGLLFLSEYGGASLNIHSFISKYCVLRFSTFSNAPITSRPCQ